jgi:adenylosuccinate synthase
VTKADVLGGLEEIPICVAYEDPKGGRRTEYPPTIADDFRDLTPVFEKLPGWPEFTARLKERLHRDGAHAVPSPLRRFLGFVTQATGVPVEYLSFGPRRDETLWLGRGGKQVSLTELEGWNG